MPRGPAADRPLSTRVVVRHGALQLDGQLLRYRLRRTPRRRHVHLTVGDDGMVEVRSPYRFSEAAAEAAIRANHDWLRHALRGAQQRRAARPALEDGCLLPLFDEQLELRLHEGAGGTAAGRRPRVWRQACRLHVWRWSAEDTDVGALLEAWYRREAREHLGARLRMLQQPLGVEAAALSIRAQRTRWGSCSARGAINLNWRLLLLPSRLADYVLVHELCHLRHMNHSPAFWALVATQLPDHVQRRQELRARQASLPL